MPLADIEAALIEHFDPEHLSVYADHLASLGDPRGELIVIDLTGNDELARERDALIDAWLGPRVAERLRHAVEVGFITELHVDEDDPHAIELLDGVLAGRGAAFVRGATIQGGASFVAAAVRKLVTREHRWLEQLSIQVRGTSSGLAIDSELAIQLAIATPNLAALEVWGRRVIGELPHTSLRSLRITGYDAVSSILGAGFPLVPKLALLDLAFFAFGDGIDAAQLTALFGPARMPALRRLDLSRNEPGRASPHSLGGTIDAFAVLERSPLLPQLTHVRMPSVRSSQHAKLVSAIAARPHVRELAIARMYRDYAHLPLERVVTPAYSFPWPPPELAPTTITLLVRDAPGVAPSMILPWRPLLYVLEGVFAELDPLGRRVWLEVLNALGFDQGIDGKSLGAALDMLPSDDVDLEPWLGLAIRCRATPKLSARFA